MPVPRGTTWYHVVPRKTTRASLWKTLVSGGCNKDFLCFYIESPNWHQILLLLVMGKTARSSFRAVSFVQQFDFCSLIAQKTTEMWSPPISISYRFLFFIWGVTCSTSLTFPHLNQVSSIDGEGTRPRMSAGDTFGIVEGPRMPRRAEKSASEWSQKNTHHSNAVHWE